MRIAVIVIVGILVGVQANAWAGPPMRPHAQRFWDHTTHQDALTRRNVAPPECKRCHPIDATRKTADFIAQDGPATKDGHRSVEVEHKFCTGSGCHSIPISNQCNALVAKDAVGVSSVGVCVLCHVESATNRACAKPPVQTEGLPSRFAHGSHANQSASGDACMFCHRAEATALAAKLDCTRSVADRRNLACVEQFCVNPSHAADPACATPHVSCGGTSGCHLDGGPGRPAMTSDCQGCHVKPAPARVKNAFAVTFDHGRHATNSKLTVCIGCHVKPDTNDHFAVLRPRMLEDCQRSCHDGARIIPATNRVAFATTGTSCTKCHHGNLPGERLAPQHFAHAAHRPRGVAIDDCAACHQLRPDGGVLPPLLGRDHQPCAKSGCHEPEFASTAIPTRGARICGVCHDTAAPWETAVARIGVRKSAAAARPLDRIEWFQDMNHAKHVASTTNEACATCHDDKLAGPSRPHAHAACAPCHATKQRPQMTDCVACHGATAPGHARASAWSVRDNFTHATHDVDPRTGQQPRCVECHDTIARATNLAGVAAPEMATCGGCHDGKTVGPSGRKVFKTTGFECAKCHLRATSRGAS